MRQGFRIRGQSLAQRGRDTHMAKMYQRTPIMQFPGENVETNMVWRMSKLAVIVLGNRRSGKSTTWNMLFGRTVRTGTDLRQLYLQLDLSLSIFLVSGSPEERRLYVGDIIDDVQP